MDHGKDDCEGNRSFSEWVPTILVGLCALWCISVAGGIIGWCVGDLDTMSDFGGWFGAISSLFSSLALGGAIYAVLLQREDLELTRQEHREARIAHQSNALSQEKMVAIQGYTTLLEEASARSNFHNNEMDSWKSQRTNLKMVFRKLGIDPEIFEDDRTIIDFKERYLDYIEIFEYVENKIDVSPHAPFHCCIDELFKALDGDFDRISILIQSAKNDCNIYKKRLIHLLGNA